MPKPSADPQFVISRIFDAKRQRVWDFWTRPELFVQWFGPKGSRSHILTHELKPGGMLHSRGGSPGGEMWARFVYRDIEPPTRLVWEHSFSDRDANVARAPFSDTWPLRLLTSVLLEEAGAGTKLTLTWSPIDATPEEKETFRNAMASMTGGWDGSFEVLDEALARAA